MAFSTYMAIAVQLEPQGAFALAAYMCIAAGLAQRGKGQAWARYNDVFRQAAATNSTCEWHRWDTDIRLMAIADPPPIHTAAQATNWGSVSFCSTTSGVPEDVCRQ